MKPRAMDSLDTVEMVMAIAEVFDVKLPDTELSTFDGPSEIVDWLEVSLSNQRPNKAACAHCSKSGPTNSSGSN
jgi:hypothetical protein